MHPKRYILPVFVPHLGCPYMCVFCDQNRISGQQDIATAEIVRQSLDEGLKKIPVGAPACVAFYGGSFTAIPVCQQEELLGAALPYVQSNRLFGIRLSTRPDYIDDNVLSFLKKYGVKTIELGIQSMDADVLKASGRGHSADDARKAAELIKKAGFELILQMMTGLPCDTPDRSIYTAQQIIDLKPDAVRIYPTVIVKGTTLYDMWLRGEYTEHTVEDAVELGAKLLDMFDESGIPVIRFGLNPTEDLSRGEAIAGAYHPALRDLAEGKRYFERECALLTSADRGADIVFGVAKGRVSAATGQKRCNIKGLTEKFGLKSVKIVECPAEYMQVIRL